MASLTTILDMVKVMAFALQEGRVAVHCHAGLGRTGMCHSLLDQVNLVEHLRFNLLLSSPFWLCPSHRSPIAPVFASGGAPGEAVVSSHCSAVRRASLSCGSAHAINYI